jgi:hypothetical protein
MRLTEEVDRLLPPLLSPRLQIAADGNWEQSVVLPLDRSSDVVPAFSSRPREIGVEVVFLLPAGRPTFIGTRYHSENADSLEEWLAGITQQAAVRPPRSLDEGSALIVGDHAFRSSVVKVDLGVFNAWNRLGSVALWRPRSRWHLDGVMTQVNEMANDPEVIKLKLPLIVEIVVDSPVEQWLGVPVATWDSSRRQYVNDTGLIPRLVQLLSDFMNPV